MPRVLITRPEPGATRTLNAISAKGIDAVSIPLTEISALAFEPPNVDFDALIVTSQNAIRFGETVLTRHKSKRAFAVGRRTAEALYKLGFQSVEWAETALKLLPKIISSAPKRILYVCGQTRRPELESGLKAADLHIEALEVYGTDITQNAAGKLKAFFASNKNAIVLLHAPSAAAVFSKAANGLNLPVSTQFLCLSSAIANELGETFRANSQIAERPDENAMLEHLDKMLASDHLRRA